MTCSASKSVVGVVGPLSDSNTLSVTSSTSCKESSVSVVLWIPLYEGGADIFCEASIGWVWFCGKYIFVSSSLAGLFLLSILQDLLSIVGVVKDTGAMDEWVGDDTTFLSVSSASESS